MTKKAQLFKSLAVAVFFVSPFLNYESFAQTVVSKNVQTTQDGKSFGFPTIYWAVPSTVADSEWNAVFGGTVIKTKQEKEEGLGGHERKFVSGTLKVEKIFLNMPDHIEIKLDSIFEGESFEHLKKGDKVIVFVNSFFDKEFWIKTIEGTNSAMGFKVKTWNDPIGGVLEKAAPCSKTKNSWVEGHEKDFRVKLYDCRAERDKIILENAEIWKRYDPLGLDNLLERQKVLKESKNQQPIENQ